jgi:hypothetical protein
MIQRLSSPQSSLALAMLLVGSSSLAQDNTHGRPIEFSDPKSPGISTNVSPLSKKSLLRELEDDLTKSFQRSLSSHSSLDGVVVPPPRTGPMIQSKKMKEQLERKKNWVFNTPEDLTSAPTLEGLLRIPDYAVDPENKKSRSSVERYYERLERKRPDNQVKRGQEESEREEGNDREDLSFLSISKYDRQEDSDAKEAAPREQSQFDSIASRIFDVKPSATFPVADSAPQVNIFGLGVATPSVEQMESHKEYLKQYEALLGPTTLVNPGSDLRNPLIENFRNPSSELRNSLSGVATLPAVTPVKDFQILSTPARVTGFDSTPGLLGSAIAPVALPDLTPKMNPWTTPSLLPKTEQPRLTGPTGPSPFPLQRQF